MLPNSAELGDGLRTGLSLKRRPIGTSMKLSRGYERGTMLKADLLGFYRNESLVRETPEGSLIKRFFNDDHGQDIIEYSLLLVLVGFAAILFSTMLGANISKLIDRINTTLRSAGNQIS